MRPTKRMRQQEHCDTTPSGGYKIKTYHPTLEEMKDFSAYIKFIHEDGGHRAGLAKIIPPAEYVARKSGYETDEVYGMDITHPIKQAICGEKGIYEQINVLMKKKEHKVREFMRMAEAEHSTPEHESNEDLERQFWKNISINPSIYGADVPGSLFDEDVEEFNLTKLRTILDDIRLDYGCTIQGVNTAYLYFGMWKTAFCWHTEDVDLYSINYLHFGQPKSWYSISPEHGKRFERLAAGFFPDRAKSCKAFLRHKSTLISPQILRKYSIPFSKCTQYKGEFMITFPYSYHSGYNHGFNIAEATNFATEYWIDFGKWATRCECSSEAVKISMQAFVKRYQPDRYENWIRGADYCKDPRDPKHIGAAPKPSPSDLYLLGNHDRQEFDIDELETPSQKEKKSKFKTKAARKVYPSLKDTVERYQKLLSDEPSPNQIQVEKELPLPEYSPVNNEMVTIESLGLDAKQQQKLIRDMFSPVDSDRHQALFPTTNAEAPPDYEDIMKKRKELFKKLEKDNPFEPPLGMNSDDHEETSPETTQELILDEGTQVVARHKDGFYYEALVERSRQVVLFEVYHPEASEVEKGIESVNIMDYDPKTNYNLGDKVLVRNPEDPGKFKQAKFMSQWENREYTVKFADDSTTVGFLKCAFNDNDDDDRDHIIYINVDQMSDEMVEKYKNIPPGTETSLDESLKEVSEEEPQSEESATFA